MSADEGLRCGVEVGGVGEIVLKGRGLRREGEGRGRAVRVQHWIAGMRTMG